jgi:16S rRNA (guanine(966)-N(2))-methyltransferase RsmD
VRIIGGSLKGRRFSPPRHFKGRPTTDFGREGLFNLLRSRLELDGLEALDLFAGSGAVSYELASRGAVSVTAIEQDSGACRYIQKQAQDFGLDAIRVVRADVFAFLGRAPAWKPCPTSSGRRASWPRAASSSSSMATAGTSPRPRDSWR